MLTIVNTIWMLTVFFISGFVWGNQSENAFPLLKNNNQILLVTTANLTVTQGILRRYERDVLACLSRIYERYYLG